MRKYEVTFMADLQTGETAVHDIFADFTQVVDGNLCFFEEYNQPTRFPGISLVKAKLVQAYAMGVWTELHEYEDDELEMVPLSPEAEERIRTAWQELNAGKDGSIAGG